MENTFCIDVSVGYNESYVNELIEFLKVHGHKFSVTKAQRGRMDEVKKLRVLTPMGVDLQTFMAENLRTGDDNEYEIHYNPVDAQRSMNFMPDYNNPLGDGEFWVIEPSA